MRSQLLCLLIVSLALAVLTSAAPEFDHGVSLPTRRPLIVAHRGASGMLPEHSIPAYQLAIDQGADVIECDVGLTHDLVPVCLHDSYMSSTTDVAEKFPDRNNTYFIIDSLSRVTDYFSVDFTLEELKTLTVKQRSSSRSPLYNGMYQIPTLEECIKVAKSANRPVGIYPETKNPQWLNSLDIVKEANTTFERILLDVLESYNYTKHTDPCFIQSFSLSSLYRLREMTSLPLVSLSPVLITNNSLDELAAFCYGIGVAKELIVTLYPNNNTIARISDLVDRAHARGLRVHAWTLKNEYSSLAYDYGLDPASEYELFLETGVDGIFTDFPHTMYRVVNDTYAECDCQINQGSPLSFSVLLYMVLSFLAVTY